MLRTAGIATVVVWFALSGFAVATDWHRYTNPSLGFSIDLPVAGFEEQETNSDRLALHSFAGDVQIEVFGATNIGDMSFADFAETVIAADPRRIITYRAGGNSWLVISGYLGPEGVERDTIFYAKFIGDRVGSALSAFEISYPRADKRAMDTFVTRLEKSLTSPRS